MHTAPRLTLCAAITALALATNVHAQAPAHEPGNNTAPSTLQTHRPGAGQPADTVREVQSTTSSSGTSAAPGAVDMNYSDGVNTSGSAAWNAGTSDAPPLLRSEVAQEAAALNRADVLPRGELSVSPHGGAAEGRFARPF